MTFFGPVLQISLVIKVIECHQSQHFYTLAKHISKGYTTSNFQKKTFLHDKFWVPQAKFSCDFYFFQYWSCYTRNKASGRNIIWRIAPFHVLKRSPHDWDSIILSSPPNSSSKWFKTGKITKIPVLIRYNFFICELKKKKIRHDDPACVAVSLP